MSTLHLLLSSHDYTCKAPVQQIATRRILIGLGNIVSPALWSTIELNIAIVASCVPAFKGCITHFHPNFLGTIRSRTGSDSKFQSRSQTTSRSRSRKASYPQDSVYHDEGFGRARNNTTTVVGHRGDMDSWDGSDEELVENGSQNRIVQTKDVWVEHEDIEARAGESSADVKNVEISRLY